jgi:threonine dehydrogenase-like Zn-dependent dehydrogenase
MYIGMAKKNIRVEKVSDSEIINPLDAITKTELTAICGSDLHLYYMPTMKAGSDQPQT